MSNVVNSRDIIKQLSKNGLQIGNKSTLNYYIRNFNYNTFIHGYSDPFYIDCKTKRYDPGANSDELINLYTFDRDMANHILRFILVIEKIINTNVAYEIINHYNIRDKCLLKFESKYIQTRILPNLSNVEPKISYDNFIYKLVKYLPSSHITRPFVQKNIRDDVTRWCNCPLDVMCLTWSFATAFSLFIALDPVVHNGILNNFGLRSEHSNGFIDFLKNTLHLRNMISHNNIIFNMNIPYQTPALINMYFFIFQKQINKIKLIHMMELIQHFSGAKTLISNTTYYFNKMKIQDKYKQKINFFGESND